MIEEIKKRLENGERVELECIDVKAISDSNKIYAETLLSSPLIFSHVFANKIIFKNRLFIYEAELKYFRIKEDSLYIEDNPTFDDLIERLVSAVRDGVLVVNRFDSNRLYILSVDGGGSFELFLKESRDEDVKSCIDFICSLYTETFVIDDNHDLMKVLNGANGILANGEGFSVSSDAYSYTNKNKLLILIGGEKMHANLSILKGATVTQKRGKQ